MESMPETSTQSPADQAPPVTSGERVLAVVALGFALLIALIGVDMLTGGKLTGMLPGRTEQQ